MVVVVKYGISEILSPKMHHVCGVLQRHSITVYNNQIDYKSFQSIFISYSVYTKLFDFLVIFTCFFFFFVPPPIQTNQNGTTAKEGSLYVLLICTNLPPLLLFYYILNWLIHFLITYHLPTRSRSEQVTFRRKAAKTIFFIETSSTSSSTSLPFIVINNKRSTTINNRQ